MALSARRLQLLRADGPADAGVSVIAHAQEILVLFGAAGRIRAHITPVVHVDIAGRAIPVGIGGGWHENAGDN